jgi:hypothetical protein
MRADAMNHMNELNIHATPASRREGTVMEPKRNTKRLVGAAITIAGLAGGVMAVHADTFAQRANSLASQDLSAPGVVAPVWPSIPSTCLADCNITLDAGTGTVSVNDTVNGPQTVDILGFNVQSDLAINDGTHTLAGGANSTIKVPLGTMMTITLTQTGISDAIDLSFPSLPIGTVTHVGNVYTVTATKVGTSVFQPGTNATAPRQIAQGLVGTLIVTPPTADVVPVDCASCAYDPTVPYADEALVAITDLDAEFAADPSGFDMSYFGQPRHADGTPRPVYHVINGKAFPDTDVIDAMAGDNVLLRYVNAGVTDKSMGLLGLRQSLLARNASPYTDPQTYIAPLIGPGETADIAITIPANAAAGQRYSLMDQGRQMNHGNDAGFGGALTFLNVWAGVTVDGLAYDISTSTLTATGHATGAATIANFQTAVTATNVEPDWTLEAAAQPTLTDAISTVVTATAGQFVWIRVQDSNNIWSQGASIEVPAAPVAIVTIDPATLTGSILSATATADLATENVTDLLYTVNDPSLVAGTSFALDAPGNAVHGTVTLTNLVDGDVIRVWATSPNSVGGVSAVTTITVVGPTINSLVFASPDQVTIDAISSAPLVNLFAGEYTIGAAAAAPSAGTSIGDVTFGTPTIVAATTITGLVSLDTVWVRVKDDDGIWSQATSVSVP